MLGLVCSDLMIFFQNSIIIAFLVMGKVWMNDALCFTHGSASISTASTTSLIHRAMAMMMTDGYPLHSLVNMEYSSRNLANLGKPRSKTILGNILF